MAATPSTMIPLGTQAPSFLLTDTVSGKLIGLPDIKGAKGTMVAFICNHCPYVIHINQALVRLAHEYQARGIGFVAISSNDVDKYPQDGPEKMRAHAQKEGYPFPYLYDQSQEIAKAYQATCTPDFFVFDEKMECVYRGQFDDTRPNKGTANGSDVRAAFDALLQHQNPIDPQYPSIGCNIKWKD
jgi:peroxiredoxin